MEIANIEEKFFLKGRGAQINPFNPFHDNNITQEHIEGLDEELITRRDTVFYKETPKKILNKIETPDAGMPYSVNPYQGCEHGCIYCYARNSHNYWGFSAGLDFETRIIAKPDAPKLLEKAFMDPKWIPEVVTFSGNTDCYQPIERKMKITRGLLEVCARFKNPVGIITKNQLVLRDKDILQDMAKQDLAHVLMTITTLDENVRSKMEPRTASITARLKTIEQLSTAGIPVALMIGPIIPGLTDHEIPDLIKAAKDHGAYTATFTMVRLNGAIGQIFTDWIWKVFPQKAERVLSNIKSVHQGQLNDSRWGKRMGGDGELAETIHKLFRLTKEKYMGDVPFKELNKTLFRRPGQMRLEF